MPPSASPRSLRRQRGVIIAVAVVLAGVGIGVPLGQHLARPTLSPPDRVASYQVTYRVTNLAAGAPGSTSWERLTVQRPFDSSDLTYPSRPVPGAVAGSGTVFTRDALYSVQAGAAHPVAGRQPGPPGDDQDLATQLPDLLARGLARDLGRTRHLAGRQCRVYRFSGPPGGAVAPLAGADHDDICLDGHGVELAERWTYRGRLVEDRRAVSEVIGPVRQPITPSGRPGAGGGAPYAVPDPAAGSFIPTPPTPSGFRAGPVERCAEPAPLGGPGALLAASVVWAFVDGSDVITVEAGQNAPGQLPWTSQPTRTAPVTLTSLGAARTAIRSDGAEIRVDLGGGRWVRIRGTVPVSGLVVYADSLRSPA